MSRTCASCEADSGIGFREGTERRSVGVAPVGLEVLLAAIVAIGGDDEFCWSRARHEAALGSFAARLRSICRDEIASILGALLFSFSLADGLEKSVPASLLLVGGCCRCCST